MSDLSIILDTVSGYAGVASISFVISLLCSFLCLLLYRKVEVLYARSDD